MNTKTVKDAKMHKFLVCACKYQDFAQSQKFFARSHDRETVTFRNSAYCGCALGIHYMVKQLLGSSLMEIQEPGCHRYVGSGDMYL